MSGSNGPTRSAIEIAFAEIEYALDMPEEFASWLHRETGEVVTLLVGAGHGHDEDEDEQRERERIDGDEGFVPIPREESQEAYADMAEFASTLEEDDVRAQVELALEGRGAFSRFRELMRRYADLGDRFEHHRRAARLRRVRDWLESEGIELELRVAPELGASPLPSSDAAGEPPRPGLVELLMLGGKAEYIGGAVCRYLYCESDAAARNAFERIAREVVAYHGEGWRKRYIHDRSELLMGRFRLVHDARHVYLYVDTPLEAYLAFTE